MRIGLCLSLTAPDPLGEAGPPTAINLAPPSITGDPRVGETLTGHRGTWDDLGETITFVDRFIVDGTVVLSDTFVPQADDVGKTVRFAPGVRLNGGPAVTASSETLIIQAASEDWAFNGTILTQIATPDQWAFSGTVITRIPGV